MPAPRPLTPKFKPPAAPRPGVMTLPWNKGAIDIYAGQILCIKYNEADMVVKIEFGNEDYRGWTGDMGVKEFPAIVRDMYARAMKGENVHFAEYVKKKDKAPAPKK